MFMSPETVDASVGEHVSRLRYWIRVRRRELGLGKGMLLRLSGVSSTGLNYVLRGEREPGLRTLCALAGALDFDDVGDLFRPIPKGTEISDDW